MLATLSKVTTCFQYSSSMMAAAKSSDSVVDSVQRTDNMNLEDPNRRVRTMTEKGLSYSMQQLCERVQKSWKYIEHKIKQMLPLFEVSNDVSIIESHRQEVDSLLIEHDKLTTAYKALMSEDEQREYDLEIYNTECLVTDFKTKLYNWLRLHRSSDCARSAISARSRSTRHSSKVSSTASQRAMHQAAKVAALETSIKFAVEEAQLEHQQLQSEQRAKSLQMEKEVAVARAELAVYKQYEAIESGECSVFPVVSSASQLSSGHTANCSEQFLPQHDIAVSQHSSVSSGICGYTFPVSTNSVMPSFSSSTYYPMSVPTFNPCVPPPSTLSQSAPVSISSTVFPPHSAAQLNTSGVSSGMVQPGLASLTTRTQPVSFAVPCVTASCNPSPLLTSDGNERLATTLSEALKQNSLPKLELSIFSDDCLEFQRWLVSFEKIIEDSTVDPVKRLHYLLQYTSGNAKVLVSGYAINQSEESYKAAKAELVKEFGNPYAVARAYLKRIESWKSIPVSDVTGLKTFSAFLKSCRGSMPSLKHLQQLDTDLYLQKIVTKLSLPLQNNWRKYVDSLEQSGKEINFAELVEFVDREARVAKHPVFSFEALQDCEGKGRIAGDSKGQVASRQSTKAVLVTTVASTDNTRGAEVYNGQQSDGYSCPKCTKSHDLDVCPEYLNLSVENRRKFLISKRLCFGCYNHISSNHDVRSCRRRRKCGECGKSHPTGLHRYQPVQPSGQMDVIESIPVEDETAVKLPSYATTTQESSIAVSIVLVKVRHASSPCREVITYAALDSMSSASFVSDDICRQLSVHGETTEITVKTMNNERRQVTEVITGLQVSPVNGNDSVSLLKAYTQETIPVGTDEIPSLDIIKSWPHISHLTAQLEPRNPDLQVGLLIGANCPKALEPREVIPSQGAGPFAVKTLLGWSISGPTNASHDSVCCHSEHAIICHRTLDQESYRYVADMGLKDMLIQMHDLDFTERNACSPALSQNDQKFLDIMESEVKIADGHYELPLPFIQQEVQLPYNKGQILKRVEGLKRKFKANEKLHSDYKKFMEDMINKNYVEEVMNNTGCKVQGVWFIPHHGVYHPQKPEKVRVVFDCSCQYSGTSLNKTLLQGPDLTNSLVGVLCRFRQQPVAITADIESMFYQVKVPEAQRDYLRFLWWPDGNITLEPKEFRMTVHLFGAISSPSCANFALRRTAMDNELQFGTAAANTLRKNFYVDDMLKSVESVESAIQLVLAVRQMCSAGGFRLTKFLSNSREVLETIPLTERAKNIVNIDLSQCPLPVERTLGVLWCIENDTFGFRIFLKDKPLTRRGVLSTISSVYDPLGLAGPFLLKGKKLLQTLCQCNSDWDDPLDDEHRVAWEHWRSCLPLLEQIQVPRCFVPTNFGQPVDVQIHHFSDASLYGYGQCSYLRLVNDADEVHCTLIVGKSRVSPLKQITVPRLELTAATVSAKVSRILNQELEYQQATNVFWTDSKAVLGYISNDAKRYHMFVANRIQLIRDLSDVNQWHYIESEMNPADDASRGLDCHNISSTHRWFQGPDFLWKPGNQWMSGAKVSQINDYDADSDPELKKSVVVCVTQSSVDSDIVDRLFKYHSSWYKLKKAVAWIMVVKTQLAQKAKKLPLRDMKLCLTVEELRDAEVVILKYVQQQTFSEEISATKANQAVKKSSTIYRLSPSWSSNNLLCVQGRLTYSSLPSLKKRPVILPSRHHVTTLLIRHFHDQYGHVGKEFVLSLLRERYWIIGARQAVRQVLRNCVTCRRVYSQPAVQKMADLPVERVTPDKPPFTFIGLDLFGPFLVKVGRSMVKRYGCIFTCLAVRAVHIEVAHSLETSSFINALQRFIARRGQPLEIRSDNGTNFVGAERELKEAVKSWNKSRTQEFLRQRESRWKFNPPSASHMGGIWERQIRTVRKIMSALINQQQLTDESLQTLLCVIENIINSRPLTAVSDDPNDTEALTPNHLLQLRSGPGLPPGDFEKHDVYCRRRWRQIQYLADVFWRRWTREYLHNLQLRSKWLNKQLNIQSNDIVLIVDDNLPRHCWMLGRVVNSLPGRDGLVRAVEVKTRSGVYTRPIHKLCLLESATDC